ncbi:MAG: lipid-A-disaccharide synthase, partial [Woeseiaceae bacterium]|nr:lipid-A-disaccharide synthase [Woeseiaceae bacterium]
LCLLPFEKKFYDSRQVAAVFVGHPLAESMPLNPDPRDARLQLGIGSEPVVAILPGSRVSEVSRLAEPFAAAARLLTDRHAGISFVAPMASRELWGLFEKSLQAAGIRDRVVVTDGNAPLAIAAADVVLLASGTATLQAALLGKPMVVAYKVAPLTYCIARTFRLFKTQWFSLPNLLTPEPLVTELMQGNATPEKLATAVSALLQDGDKREKIADAFGLLRKELSRDADRLAALAVLELAKQSAAAGVVH